MGTSRAPVPPSKRTTGWRRVAGGLVVLVVLVGAVRWSNAPASVVASSGPAGGVTYSQPLLFRAGRRWIRLESITVRPGADVLRGVVHLLAGDRFDSFSSIQACPSNFVLGACQFRCTELPIVATNLGTFAFHVTYLREPGGGSLNPNVLPQFSVYGLFINRDATLTRTVTLPLPAGGARLGSAGGDTVSVQTLDDTGMAIRQTYPQPREIRISSGFLGIGAMHITPRPAVASSVNAGAVTVAGRAHRLQNLGGDVYGPHVVPVDLTWAATPPKLHAGERVTLSVVVSESWTFPTAGRTWPAYPWYWQVGRLLPRLVPRGLSHARLEARQSR